MKTAISGRHITWRQLLDCQVSPFTPADQVYAIRDSADTVIYVGKATDMLERLLTHVGEGSFTWATAPSKVGEYRTQPFPTSACSIVTAPASVSS